MSSFPFTIKYTNVTLSPECKRFCKLLIPGAVIPCGRYAKQLCHERIIDTENIKLFTIWCHDKNDSALYKAKVGLDLDKVYNHFFPQFDDSETVSINIIPEKCIPAKSFEHLVREIASQFGDYHFEKDALDALQEVSEEHLVKLFNIANLCAKHANRVTINVDDLKLASK